MITYVHNLQLNENKIVISTNMVSLNLPFTISSNDHICFGNTGYDFDDLKKNLDKISKEKSGFYIHASIGKVIFDCDDFGHVYVTAIESQSKSTLSLHFDLDIFVKQFRECIENILKNIEKETKMDCIKQLNEIAYNYYHKKLDKKMALTQIEIAVKKDPEGFLIYRKNLTDEAKMIVCEIYYVGKIAFDNLWKNFGCLIPMTNSNLADVKLYTHFIENNKTSIHGGEHMNKLKNELYVDLIKDLQRQYKSILLDDRSLSQKMKIYVEYRFGDVIDERRKILQECNKILFDQPIELNSEMILHYEANKHLYENNKDDIEYEIYLQLLKIISRCYHY